VLLAGSMVCFHASLGLTMLALYVVVYYDLESLLLLYLDMKSSLLRLRLKGKFGYLLSVKLG
jgi:hypothetical protein